MPALDHVDRIARTLRELWGQRSTTGRLDLESALTATRARAEATTLGAVDGGTQGLLIPLEHGGFGIAVDPAPGPDDRVPDAFLETARRQRSRFLIAHELAHTIFYRRPDSGAPARLAFDSPAQEIFCDRLAAALLVPPVAARNAGSRVDQVASLQRRFDVEALLALRSLMDTSEGKAAWLVCDPEDEDPSVRWGSPETGLAVEPWPVLLRLLGRARKASGARCKLGWRSGETTIVEGHYLRPQRLMAVVARTP